MVLYFYCIFIVFLLYFLVIPTMYFHFVFLIITYLLSLYPHPNFINTKSIAPYAALNFTLYDIFKKQMLNWYQASESINQPTLPISLSLTCGALAGAGATTVTYPLEVIRRRCHLLVSPTTSQKYANLFQFTAEIVKKEGVQSLYRGLAPCYLKVR